MAPFIVSNDFALLGGEPYIWAGGAAGAVYAVNTGQLVSKITSGTYSGQFGPTDLNQTDGRQTITNIIGPVVHRIGIMDAAGYNQRVLPNQDSGFFTFCNRASAALANNITFIDTTANQASGIPITINTAVGSNGAAIKAQLQGRGFFFED